NSPEGDFCLMQWIMFIATRRMRGMLVRTGSKFPRFGPVRFTRKDTLSLDRMQPRSSEWLYATIWVMRDAKRIDFMLAQLKLAWKQYPDLRLTLLIGTAAALATQADLPVNESFVEDDVLLQGLRTIATHKRPER